MWMTRIIVGLSAVVLTACSLSKQDAPPLAGPSEFALSLAVSASPDLLSQDGKSQALVSVIARDANGQPKRGLSLRLAMFVGDVSVDYGTLSTKSISTDNGGSASAIYTAPMPPPLTDTSDKVVTIQVLPIGSDFANTTARYVEIRLARPGVILPPNPAVSASFFFSPGQPREDEQVQFDASASTGANLQYSWSFGDGSSGTGVRPTHTYSVAGVYSVVLTVADDRGTQASSAPVNVTVVGAPDPTALFVFSPTDPTAGDEVFFDGSLSTTPVGTGRTIVGYEWNFGDGGTGSGKTTSHRYSKTGTYTVVLNVRDSSGRRGTASKTIQVK